MNQKLSSNVKVEAVRSLSDRLGIVLSSLCLVHCLALPFLSAFLPVLGLEVFLHESVHQTLAGLLILTSGFAFVPDYLKHGKRTVLFWAVLGLGTLVFTAFVLHRIEMHALELPLNILGGLCLIVAHALNGTFCKICSNCPH